MKKILLNYADRRFLQSQKLNAQTGLGIGGFDTAITLGRNNLDAEFCDRNQFLLSQPRGAGYWVWKPYIILQTLRHAMQEDDVLFYSDSGAHFLQNAAPYIDICRSHSEKPVLLFSLAANMINRNWTKRDCFHYMDADRPPYLDQPQILSSYIVCEKNAYTMDFFAAWLRYTEDERLVTDMRNQCGLPNYPGFVEHRHDQSILSLLGRKEEIALAGDPSQWGNDYRAPALPQIIACTRNPA